MECRLAATGILVEHWFHVDNWRPVHSLEVSDANPKSVNTDDLDLMQPDWVGAMWAARGEHTFLWSRQVAARMDAQHAAIGEVEPREDENLVADAQGASSFTNISVKDEPRLGRSLVSLARSVSRVDQRRFNMAN